MSAIRIKKEDFELMSNKDVAILILENSKRPKSTADLFKKIIKLGNLPEKVFEEKVGDFYTVLATSKEFVQLDDGRWDLKTKHKSNVMKIDDSEEEDEEEEILIDDFENAPVEDNYDDEDEPYTDDELDDDLKDLVIIDEDELDLNN